MGNGASVNPEVDLDGAAGFEERKKLPALTASNLKQKVDPVNPEDLAKQGGGRSKKKIPVDINGAQPQQQQYQPQGVGGLPQQYQPPIGYSGGDTQLYGAQQQQQYAMMQQQYGMMPPQMFTPQQAQQQTQQQYMASTYQTPLVQQHYQTPFVQPQYNQYNQSKEAEPDDDNASPVDILLQFIPYYGQGDPSNDSIVRATLNGLSINDIDSKDEYGNTLLLLACQYRCEDLVRIMLGKGADPNAINTSGACGLHFACYKESASLHIARVLLQNGANPEVCELTYGCTPLHYCAGNGDIEFCKLMLSHGALVGTVDYYSYTCVDYAREAGYSDLSSMLQVRLDKYNQQQQARNNLSGHNLLAGGVGAVGSPFAPQPLPDTVSISGEGWQAHTDPVSRAKYYINDKTGECLWENDLRIRLQTAQQQYMYEQRVPAPSGKLPDSPAVQSDSMAAAAVVADTHKASSAAENYTVIDARTEGLLMAQTSRARLIAFLGKNDPARLVEIEQVREIYLYSFLVFAKRPSLSQFLNICSTYYHCCIKSLFPYSHRTQLFTWCDSTSCL